MELRGDDQFRIRSYRTAADLIADLQTPIEEIAKQGGAAELRKLPGIGEAISRKIIDIVKTGTTKLYEELNAEIPATVLDLLEIEGIGMKTLEVLYRQFQVTNLDDFAKFVAGGGLESVPRLGEKAQLRIRASLKGRGYYLEG